MDDPSTAAGRFALPRGVRIQEYALVAVIIALLVVGAILKPDTFPTSDNLRAIFTQSSVVGVIAIGMTLVIATSGIDLSVGSIVAAAGIAGGLLIDNGAVAFVFGALGFALLLGHGQRRRRSPTAGSCPSSPRWPCWRSPAGSPSR